jgi:RNA polymerase sigma-70 factor, ECF subfamily
MRGVAMACTNSVAVWDDAELIAETLQGRSESFGELVRKYQDRLYNAVVHIVGDMEEARDVVQEAMVQAFRHLGSFRNSSAFYTWLYRIAFNTAANRRRRKHVFASLEYGRESKGAEPMDRGPAPSERLEREERCQCVRRAIARLTDQQRAVLVLREIEGLHYEEIAEILALPVGTVRSRLHRARTQLRERLTGTLALEPLAAQLPPRAVSP